MKPDWDKLMADFADSTTSLVADVDCTTDGKDLCEKHKVQGYPTIKYGDPNDLKDYNGGRSYDDFKKFADENLGPSCGPDHLDLCKEEDKATIEKLIAMPMEELDKLIADVDEKIKKITDKHDAAVKKLESKVEAATKESEAAQKKADDAVKKETKKLGLGVMRKVLASRKKKEDL